MQLHSMPTLASKSSRWYGWSSWPLLMALVMIVLHRGGCVDCVDNRVVEEEADTSDDLLLLFLFCFAPPNLRCRASWRKVLALDLLTSSISTVQMEARAASETKSTLHCCCDSRPPPSSSSSSGASDSPESSKLLLWKCWDDPSTPKSVAPLRNER